MNQVSGDIYFDQNSLREEGYYIQRGSALNGLNTENLTPEDLRKLADHLEKLREERAS